MEVIGIDIGFGFTKVATRDEVLIFKSLLGEPTDMQFRANIGNGSFIKNLYVTIDGKSYFIGDFAEQQSNVRRFTLDNEKLISEFVKVLAVTAIGIRSEKDIPINVVSGLPVGYLRENRERFLQILTGHHNITYHNPDGSETRKRITIDKIQMLPQPLGSVFSLLMNGEGKATNMELAKQKIGVIDIGFRTTDFAILNRLKLGERGSSTIEMGISTSFSEIADKLREMSGVSVELYRMYKAVETGSIKIRGQEYNISNLKDQTYSVLAGKIAGVINQLWADEWDIDMILLTGGGGAELTKYLEPLIAGDVIPIENSIDARLNNVQGYLKFGKYKWG